jgi:DNA anti-recombination protein RmuC
VHLLLFLKVYELQAQLESSQKQSSERLGKATEALVKEQEVNRQLQGDKESLEAALALVSEAPGKVWPCK